MDRLCEFCVNSRSTVYCNADAAYLCLSCDAMVHSANPLSGRHHRTLICEWCKCRPTYVRCYNHETFMCRGCDHSQHNASCHHCKRVITSFIGCPSAQDLGALWGLDVNQFAVSDKLGSNVVLQQLLELMRVKLSDDGPTSSLIRGQEQTGVSVSLDCDTQEKLDNECDELLLNSALFGRRPRHNEPNLDPCSSPFVELDHLADESTLQDDSFWLCKSPGQSSQLWSQNMQDLGVCEEPEYLDDLNMPDIDLTFRNFEELFQVEQEPGEDINSPSKKAQNTSFSSGAEGVSSSIPLVISVQETLCGSHDHDKTKSRENTMIRSKGEMHVQQKDRKQGPCGYRRARSDIRKRVKSQSWKSNDHKSTTRSY